MKSLRLDLPSIRTYHTVMPSIMAALSVRYTQTRSTQNASGTLSYAWIKGFSIPPHEDSVRLGRSFPTRERRQMPARGSHLSPRRQKPHRGGHRSGLLGRWVASDGHHPRLQTPTQKTLTYSPHSSWTVKENSVIERWPHGIASDDFPWPARADLSRWGLHLQAIHWSLMCLGHRRTSFCTP